MAISMPGLDSNTNPRAGTGLRTRPTFRDVIMEVMRIKYEGVVMKPLVRKLLHEELERIVPRVIDQIASAVSQQVQGELQNVVSQIIAQTQHVVGQQMDRLIAHTSQPLRFPTPEGGQLAGLPTPHIEEATQEPKLQLVFVKGLGLSQPIYADDEIKDKDNNHIQVCLQQIENGESCIFSPQSRVQLEIVVLDGTFAQENVTDWNADELNRYILHERENKRRLLEGKCKVDLRDGIASFGTLRITDNSSWVKSGEFRLGVRISPESCVRHRIKEAISECFVVLDRRNKTNQKADRPSLDDKVWRLKKIGKTGPIKGRLANAGIETVQDLLKLAVVNLQRLRDIVKMQSNHAFDETIRHAKTCEMGDDHYIFKIQCFTFVLNPICEVVKVLNADGSTCSFDQGSPQIKEIQELAYNDWNNLEKIHGVPQTNTIRSQEPIDSVREGKLEPHNWNYNNLHPATYDPHRGPFIDGGESASVIGQLPQPLQLHMGNAQNPVLMEPLNWNNWSGSTNSGPVNCIFADNHGYQS